jgi:hypothetical protein
MDQNFKIVQVEACGRTTAAESDCVAEDAVQVGPVCGLKFPSIAKKTGFFVFFPV